MDPDVDIEVCVDVSSVVFEATGRSPCKISPPRPAVVVAADPFKAKVLVPMTRPEGPSEIVVPEMVMAAPFAERVVPAMEKAVELAVNVVPATLKIDWKDGAARGRVLLPIIRAEGPSETGVPEIVTAGPPWEMVVPAMEKAVGLAVNVLWATVKIDWMGVEGSGIVLLPTTRPAAPRDTVVPDTVIDEPPGVSVVESSMTAPVGPIEIA